ncbi:uncharacterized protein AMSG_11759 [Thecamonas trahens ATCC 50062]|uniref:Cyclic nucleotide-binding domain-containing protein n=1 Tax=Thecamonas trahens ATCC 50062 TaxID=461836 RepID=A0A0L0D3X5_THETB|nr:hypothetical protein AMSG_11759 [Thecamonas trahens ATCC 50062]KNC46786.1 hypothetical protein AMSG_11759 [Thecamonas trahens ATCC 50062]|eukprot:XP_013760257.1 hypothetical protein AMSG_11759 [Thecamonas trahens ATCC 50062]
MELPVTLRTNVAMFMNRELFSRVPLFQNASPGFVESLAPYLKPQIFSPGDVVIKEGSTGAEMFFISRGTAKVIEKGEVVNTLHQGAYFGEMSLLVPDSARTATVQTVSYCDLFVLSKADLATVLKLFPAEEAKMMKRAKRLKWRADLRKVLAGLPMLAGSSEKFLIQLRDAFELRVFRSTETVFTTDAPVDALFFVAQGWIQLMSADGRLGPQITTSGLIGGISPYARWSGDGRAGAHTVVLALSAEAHAQFSADHPNQASELTQLARKFVYSSEDHDAGSGGDRVRASDNDQAQLERVVPLLGDMAELMTGDNVRFMASLRHDSLQLERLSSEQLLLASEALSRLGFVITTELFARRSSRAKSGPAKMPPRLGAQSAAGGLG